MKIWFFANVTYGHCNNFKRIHKRSANHSCLIWYCKPTKIYYIHENKSFLLRIINGTDYGWRQHVHTLRGTCVWISWGNILLLTLYDPICIILKWKKLLNLITSLLLLGYSIGIHQVIFYIFSYFSHKILI